MKKFIINFDYKGFLFSARVLLKRDNGHLIISTALINTELRFLLGDGKLLFIQQGEGFQLLLFNHDRSFQKLKWGVKMEYVDQTQIVDGEVFSLS